MENIYEQFFFLKYQGGWSLSESYNLPIGLRTWFVKRLVQQLEKENEAVENAKKGGSKGSQTLTAHNQPAMPPHMQKSMNKRRGE
tara:strand:+ start:512 stop:766 length:255 start_codon:yes stop_codon:yes gene_type:complete